MSFQYTIGLVHGGGSPCIFLPLYQCIFILISLSYTLPRFTERSPREDREMSEKLPTFKKWCFCHLSMTSALFRRASSCTSCSFLNTLFVHYRPHTMQASSWYSSVVFSLSSYTNKCKKSVKTLPFHLFYLHSPKIFRIFAPWIHAGGLRIFRLGFADILKGVYYALFWLLEMSQFQSIFRT